MLDSFVRTEDSQVAFMQENTTNGYVKIDGEPFLKISDYDQMKPFFMTIVSPSDHWLFISSNGGITAGRINAESALFPYYTDDKIMDLADITGSQTVLKVEHDGFLVRLGTVFGS